MNDDMKQLEQALRDLGYVRKPTLRERMRAFFR